MSDADDAYKEAERLIAEAKESGDNTLSFGTDEAYALKSLPPEISHITGLQTLDLSETQITDLAPIASMRGVTELYLKNTPISDLTPIADMADITFLAIYNTQITDLTPLKKLKNITTFFLNGAQVSDITPLAELGFVEIQDSHLS
ncbi:leucine-rich repeat domain-containing protein [Profundibacter sp.]